MEERGNKTIMCSVLFLDIVEYSKKSVSGQISLKDRFNSYLSLAISDVPMTDRIILDTGDGAAINFLGDVEDALKAALSLRESLLNEGPDVDHPLLVRMGINLGPVRLVRDINGQPNIVGDGINVAQRVMGFADAAQILVSRSYFDAVSRLSPQYSGMFHYQGSRTDKHVREHEVYAIGYPGDKTTRRGAVMPMVGAQAENTWAGTMLRAKAAWNGAAARLDTWLERAITRFRRAQPWLRAVYATAIAVPVVALIAVLVNTARHDDVAGRGDQAVKTAPQSAMPSVSANSATQPASPVQSQVAAEAKTGKDKVSGKAHDKVRHEHQDNAAEKQEAKRTDKVPDKLEEKPKSRYVESTVKMAPKDDNKSNVLSEKSSGGSDAIISVACVEGAEVFIDGIRKGRIGSAPLSIVASPGNHSLIVSHTSRGIFTQSVELHPGKTVRINPPLCH
ncbi:MAG: PEGA domain-containing protein [Nitrosomonadales bacterium]|nr:PEGA domain-containing protein [Nitrosomonadales bacterium]